MSCGSVIYIRYEPGTNVSDDKGSLVEQEPQMISGNIKAKLYNNVGDNNETFLTVARCSTCITHNKSGKLDESLQGMCTMIINQEDQGVQSWGTELIRAYLSGKICSCPWENMI